MPPKSPLVSIVIPCYNAAARLESCLKSCWEQTYPHLEILVVDNGSTDESVVIAQGLGSSSTRSLRVLHCPQRGANRARNLGYTAAQGEYIQWLDADDELGQDKIARQVTALEQQPQFDLACSDWEWCFYDQGSCQWRLEFSVQCWTDPVKQHLLHHWHPPHAYLLRRTAADRLQAIPAWNPDTPIGTDREYFTWAALIGYQFLAVPGARVSYNHWDKTQMSRAAPYLQRIQSLQQMFSRFRQDAQVQANPTLTGDHWCLLKQNWEVWKLSPAQISQQGDQCFWMQRCDPPIGLTLSPAETQIVVALNQLGGAYTLDDHAHRILRHLAKQVLQQPDRRAPDLSTALAEVVGLLPSDRSVNYEPLNPTAPPTWLDPMPLYAPLFPETRLVILQLLDKLRVAGLLTRVTLQPGA